MSSNQLQWQWLCGSAIGGYTVRGAFSALTALSTERALNCNVSLGRKGVLRELEKLSHSQNANVPTRIWILSSILSLIQASILPGKVQITRRASMFYILLEFVERNTVHTWRFDVDFRWGYDPPPSFPWIHINDFISHTHHLTTSKSPTTTSHEPNTIQYNTIPIEDTSSSSNINIHILPVI